MSAAEIATLTEQVRQLTAVSQQLAATMVPQAVCEERCRSRQRELTELSRRQAVVEQRPVRWLPIALTAAGVLIAGAAFVLSLAR